MEDKQATFDGVVERIAFRNEENGYTVLKMKAESAGPLALSATAVGRFPAVAVGQRLKLWGQWVHHPQYGRQLSVTDFAVVAPETLEGMRRYLGSGLIPGIGPALADRLVAHFRENTLHVIEHEPERLREVDGIGPKRASAIAAAARRQRAVQQIMVFLQGYGIGPAHALRIWRTYGDEAVQTVRDNPYRLATDVAGIGFKTADNIARTLGIGADAPQRRAAGLLYVLDEAASRGHVLLPRDGLTAQTEALLGVDRAALAESLDELSAAGRVVQEDGTVYTPRLHRAEAGLAAGLRRLMQRFLLVRPVEGEGAADAAGGGSVRLSPEQQAAVEGALSHGVFVITGGPGTGKTTILRALVTRLEAMGRKVQLACPTGRAAQRLKEVTGRDARTLHRLLEFGPGDSGGFRFQRNEDAPLSADAIIVDEASMVDLPLAWHLVRAVPDGAQLIFVGDVDQLPPVGPGYPLRDMIDSGVVPVARLTRIFRQAERSLIVVNAHRLLRGEPLLWNRRHGDFFFVECDDNDEVPEQVRQLALERVPQHIGGDPVEDVQVLSPMRRSPTGVDYLNELLQASLNPPSAGKPEWRSGPLRLRLGDKVMQTRNNYDKGVFNGDVGRVTAVDEEEGTVLVRFPQPEGPHTVAYGAEDADELTLAYCMTVHKSQGSEYPAVIMPITTQHYTMLQRNLLYTAVTRARRLVVLVGSRKAVRMALAGVGEEPRMSRLKERLRGEQGGADDGQRV